MNPLEYYLTEIATLRGATKETSGYPALATLLTTLGQTLKPKVRCLIHPKNSGAGKGGVTMPGKGKLETRGYTAEEAEALAVAAVCDRRPEGDAHRDAATLLGPATHDIFLNETACWRNVPEKVWDFTLGGYQVMKKWLSYREHALLGRALTPDEAREVTHMARRIAALILLQPALDANYLRVKEATYDWKP